MSYFAYRSQRQGRQLGSIEELFHHSHVINKEKIVLVAKVAASSPVELPMVISAVDRLTRCHPLLRMRIIQNEVKEFRFQEVEDCNVVETINMKTRIGESFLSHLPRINENDPSPLWKLFIYPQPCEGSGENSGTTNIFHFIWVWHHAIADFLYMHYVMTNLLAMLSDVVHADRCIGRTERILPLTPCIDDVLRQDATTIRHHRYQHLANASVGMDAGNGQDVDRESSSSNYHMYKIADSRMVTLLKENGVTPIPALKLYNKFLAEECSRQLMSSSAHHRWRFSAAQTEAILKNVSKFKFTSTGLLMAATSLALCRQLRKNVKDEVNPVITVLFEVLVSLRRFIKVKVEPHPLFPGCAAIHVPLKLDVSEKNNLCFADFIETAQHCSEALSAALNSPSFVQEMFCNVQSENKVYTGKSSLKGSSNFVFCLSNVGRIKREQGTEEESSRVFQILDINVEYDLSGPEMPLLLCSSSVLDECLILDVHYSVPRVKKTFADAFLCDVRNLYSALSQR